MDDTISRQAAIDAVENITSSMSVCVNTDECYGMKRMQRRAVIELTNLPSAQPYTEADIQKMQDLEQAELQKAYECGRASAQSEIVRCKDCKWYGLPSHKITENCVRWMKSNGILLPIKPDDFCSYAERREE